jgi:hypothetical protein
MSFDTNVTKLVPGLKIPTALSIKYHITNRSEFRSFLDSLRSDFNKIIFAVS